ncbi:MAG TPA: endolytic transglycosylase MltG [Saprospiraceae bacterium]|nr:endolytic transglycosylase MltG [Saprospiraceae bacterium]
MKRFLWIGIPVFLLLLGILTAYLFFSHKGISACDEENYFYIPTKTDKKALFNKIKEDQDSWSQWSLPYIAQLMRFEDRQVKPGRYYWEESLSNLDFLRMIRSGRQQPLRLVIFRANDIAKLAGLAGSKLEPDSLEFLDHLSEPSIYRPLGFNKDNFLTLFIPNTYEFYWNTSPKAFLERMRKEHDEFWTDQRRKALDEQQLNVKEAYILASIIEKETRLKSERKTIAGVYLNRLRRGMLLQADPTVVFAMKGEGIRRVLNKHLKVDSPYNTYLYPGLPPGPVAMPSLASIDAVVFPEKHNYLYFCAKPGYDGGHAFASSLSGHNANARVYRSWLNKEGIYE